MAIKQIVVIVDLKGRRPAVELAADLAGQVGARLTGLAVRYDPVAPAYALGGVPGDFIVAAQANSEQAASASRAAFEETGRRAGISYEAETVDLGYGEVDGVVLRARLSDLAVVGQDDPDEPEPMRPALIESLLFEAGVPVLLVPHSGVTAFKSRKALVAWDGSATAARAVRAALPLLGRAEEVEVLTVDRGKREKAELGADIGSSRPEGRRHPHRPGPRARRRRRAPQPHLGPGLRLAGDGRLRPQPRPRGGVRRPDPRHPRRADRAGADGPLKKCGPPRGGPREGGRRRGGAGSPELSSSGQAPAPRRRAGGAAHGAARGTARRGAGRDPRRPAATAPRRRRSG